MAISPKEVADLADELQNDSAAIERNQRDDELYSVFYDGKFSGKLFSALRAQNTSSKMNLKLINMIRETMVDQINNLLMLPDIKVDPPEEMPGEDQLFWQDQIKDILQQYFWEQRWNLPSRINDIAFNLSVYGRCPLQLHPNFKDKSIDLFVRHPSFFYGVTKAGGGGWHHYQTTGSGFPPTGGHVLSPALFIYKAQGRSILRDYPWAEEKNGVKNTADEYEIIEYSDENVTARFIGEKPDRSVGKERKLTPMKRSDGNEMYVEHNFGFVPVEFIQDVGAPGRTDATTKLYYSIILDDLLNDLILMNTEEHRSRLAQVLVIKNAVDVPSPWPAHGDAVVKVGPQGSAEYLAKIANASDMGQHIEAIKQLTFMGMGTSPTRMGELPSSVITGKGVREAATVPVSDEILNKRNKIALALKGANQKAWYMLIKMFPDAKQTMTIRSTSGAEPLTFKPNQLPEHFRHNLEVFPLANDIPGKIMSLMQLEGTDIISKRTAREGVPGIDAKEEARRIREEKQEEMQLAMEMQMAAAKMQAAATAPEDMETQAMGMEKGGIPR